MLLTSDGHGQHRSVTGGEWLHDGKAGCVRRGVERRHVRQFPAGRGAAGRSGHGVIRGLHPSRRQRRRHGGGNQLPIGAQLHGPHGEVRKTHRDDDDDNVLPRVTQGEECLALISFR